MEIRVSTAAVMSARFPFITPPATIRIPKTKTAYKGMREIHALDGGFVENSGSITALDLQRDLENFIELSEYKNKIEIRIIGFSDKLVDASKPKWFSNAFVDVLSLARTANNIRLSRGVYFASKVAKSDSKNKIFYLSDSNFQPPLGWVLSQRTFDLIDRRSGRLVNEPIAKENYTTMVEIINSLASPPSQPAAR